MLLAAVALSTLALPDGAAFAGDRLRMNLDPTDSAVKECVQTAAKAVCDEDLDAFLGCFASRERPRMRRRTALLFVTHTLDLEVLDSHVISEKNDRAELAVNYQVMLTDDAYSIVSILDMVNEQGSWKIAGEQVQGSTFHGASESGSGEVFRFGGGGDAVVKPGGQDLLPWDIGRRPGGGCANGRCGL